MEPWMVQALTNAAFVVVLAFVGWLAKRAISNLDDSVRAAGNKAESIEKSVNELKLLIVSDFYPRKEHMAYADQVLRDLEQIRKNIHDLRDKLQPIVAEQAMIRVLLRERGMETGK